jgi:hypothetical protein
VNGIRTLAHLVSLIGARCIDWEARRFDSAKCLHLIRVYMGLEKSREEL